MVRVKDACEIIELAVSNNIELFIDGGWGIDALLGFETRLHNDIDLFVEKRYYKRFIEIIRNKGFCEKTEEYSNENHSVWKDSYDRIIDLHCFEYTSDQNIKYEGEIYSANVFSGKGIIGHIEVNCIEPESQVAFHLGYEHDKDDIHDVLLLCKAFDIPIPNEYTE